MNADQKKAKLEAIRQHIKRHDEAWLAWSQRAAESAVQDLISGKVLHPDQADFARKIFAEDLHDAGRRSFRRVLAESPR
jgi:hypothetical protein